MKFISPFILMLLFFSAKAQVGIGTTSPHQSSIVDIESKNKGFLPPRLTRIQRNGIQNPADGLLIYCTDCCIDGMISFYAVDKWVYPIDCSAIDFDDDGIPNNIDIDDDNDGIPDINEYQELVFNNYSGLPTGLAYSTKRGMRITDASGNYAIDVYDSYGDFPQTSHEVEFHTSNGEIEKKQSNNSNIRAYAVVTWTTENSPIAWQFTNLIIDDIQSLSNDNSSSCDAYSFDNQASWDYLPGSPAVGTILSINPNTTNKIGNFLTNDPDATAAQLPHQISDIGTDPSFATAYANSGNTIKEVVLNLYDEDDGHALQASFPDQQTKVNLHIWDAAEPNSMSWGFIARSKSFIINDADNDGSPDHLDTDSDNDGCPDAIESGAVTGANQADFNSNTGTFTGNFGNNGLHNSVENADITVPTLNYTINSNYQNSNVSTACP
jgi:hypothetical protein